MNKETLIDSKNWFGLDVKINPKSVIVTLKIYETDIFSNYQSSSGVQGLDGLTAWLTEELIYQMKDLGFRSAYTFGSLVGKLKTIFVKYKTADDLELIKPALQTFLSSIKDKAQIRNCVENVQSRSQRLDGLGFV